MTQIRVTISVLALSLVVVACQSTKPETTRVLSGPEFKAAFERDCTKINGIEELHSGSGYFIDLDSNNEFTYAPFSLGTMSSWLKKCGRDPESISQILE